MRKRTLFPFWAFLFLSGALTAQLALGAPVLVAFKGEISGIAPKRITINTSEPVSVGETLQVARGSKIIASLKIANKNGKTIIAEIINASGDIQFSDMLVWNKPQKTQEEIPVVKETKTHTSKSPQLPEETAPPPEEFVLPPAEIVPAPKENTPPKTEVKVTKMSAQNMSINVPAEPLEPLPSPLEKEDSQENQSSLHIGYSLLAPNNIKYSNRGYKVEFRKKFQDTEKLYDAVSYGEFTWNDADTKLTANVFTFTFLYSLKSLFHPGVFSINEAFLTAGYSHITARLSGASGAIKKSTSGHNFGISMSIFKHLNIDYQLHFFSLKFPNAPMGNGEQLTLSFYYSF